MISRRGGFTFVELLVALVISSILALFVFQVMLSQGRFNRLFSAREEVQQNLRTGIDLLASDLRAVAPGSQQGTGILLAESNELQLRAVRAWGLVCGLTGGRLTVLYPMDAVGSLPETPNFADSLAFATPTNPWQFSGATDVSVNGVSDAVTTCNEALSPLPQLVAGAWDRSQVRLYNAAAAEAVVAQLVGNRVYVYDRINYSVGADPGGRVPGQWLLRNDDPIAGPLPDGGTGLSLTYLDRAGVEIVNPIGAQLDDIHRVRFVLQTISSSRIAGQTDSQVDTVQVFLRNRI